MCLRAFILQIEISPLPKTVWELMHCFVVLFTQELVALDGLKSHVNDAGSSNFRWDVMNDRIPRLRSFSNGGNSLFYPLFSIQGTSKNFARISLQGLSCDRFLDRMHPTLFHTPVHTSNLKWSHFAPAPAPAPLVNNIFFNIFQYFLSNFSTFLGCSKTK